MNKKIHVKTGDTVQVISGKDRTKEKNTGKVLAVSPKEGKVIVEGLNIVKKHMKPKQQGQLGEILEVEGAMYASKVMLVCPKCKKTTRLAHKMVGDGDKKQKMRACKHCGETF